MIKETLHNFKQAIKYPRLAVYEAERPLRKLFSPAIKSFFELRYGTGLDVIEQDWDTLVILDACRYDSFKQCRDLKGSLQPAVSRGAHSWEFMQGNFVDRELHDTVYVRQILILRSYQMTFSTILILYMMRGGMKSLKLSYLKM